MSDRPRHWPPVPKVFWGPRPPRRLTATEALSIASHARPFGDLATVYRTYVGAPAGDGRRGPYRRRSLHTNFQN